MPTKRFSRELIRKLHLLTSRIDRRFMRYPSADTRRIAIEPNPFESVFRGQRVRELNLSRQTGFPVVVKRVHDLTAQQTIDRINSRVKEHNLRVHSNRYALMLPHAYVVGRHYVLMEKVSFPTLEEASDFSIPEARAFVHRLLEKSGLSLSDLKRVAAEVVENSGIRADNLFLAGVRKKRLIIVPLIDSF